MTQYSDLGYITISWTNAAKDADFIAWRVYRRTIGSDVFNPTTASPWALLYETEVNQSSYAFHDWEAPVGLQTQWAVVQVASRFGSEVESTYPASTPIIPVSTDYWLIHPTDETKNLKLHVKGDRFHGEIEQAVVNLIERGRHVDYGTDYGKTGELNARIRRDNVLTPTQQRQRLEQIQAEMTAMKLRTPFGHVWTVALGDIPMTREPGVGTEELMDIDITYNEVVDD